MPAYKDEKQGTYYVSFYYTDYTGTKRKKLKRGFERKRDALEWERKFLLQKKTEVIQPFLPPHQVPAPHRDLPA